MASAFGCVYRISILGSLCPLMAATSGMLRPFSKNRLTASWRRSWKRKPDTPARRLKRSQASLSALAEMGNTVSPTRGVVRMIATARGEAWMAPSALCGAAYRAPRFLRHPLPKPKVILSAVPANLLPSFGAPLVWRQANARDQAQNT
jgi:hypothetical protein